MEDWFWFYIIFWNICSFLIVNIRLTSDIFSLLFLMFSFLLLLFNNGWYLFLSRCSCPYCQLCLPGKLFSNEKIWFWRLWRAWQSCRRCKYLVSRVRPEYFFVGCLISGWLFLSDIRTNWYYSGKKFSWQYFKLQYNWSLSLCPLERLCFLYACIITNLLP